MPPVSLVNIMKDYAAEYIKYKPSDGDNRVDEEDLSGKIIIVTGCNTGLGRATVIELAKRGAHIIMACRDLDKTRETLFDIKNIYPEAKLVRILLAVINSTYVIIISHLPDCLTTTIQVSGMYDSQRVHIHAKLNDCVQILELDLGDLDSVRAFAKNVKEKYPHINILINNAGISKPTGVVEKTKDGFETHMGVNHLGHFLLTLLLLDHIKKGAPGRIITVASTLHLRADLDTNDLMLEKVKSWGPGNLLGYSNSKLANMLFTRELSKRLEGTGITTYALCPGVVQTDIGRNRQSWFQKISASGAQTTIRCATSKSWANESGQMYRFESKWDQASQDLDEELGLRLWYLSEKLVGLEISSANDPAVLDTTNQLKTIFL